MYEITYRVISFDKLKRALVCAASADQARKLLLSEFMQDTISITSTRLIADGTVIYPNGRW